MMDRHVEDFWQNLSKCKAVIIAIFLIISFSSVRGEPIRIYDLRYTLKIDPGNPGQVRMAWDHCHLVAALQGLVNREVPSLYIRFVDSQQRRRNVDDYWFSQLAEPGRWLHGRERKVIADIDELIRIYRPQIRGVVVYDPAVAATSNVASMVAGCDGLLPVRYDTSAESLYARIVASGPKLPVKCRLVNPDGSSIFTGRGLIPGTNQKSTGSAKCDAYLWAKKKYMDTGKCDGSYGAYYLDQYWIEKPRNTVLNHHCLTNHDFFISKKAFFFDLQVVPDVGGRDPGHNGHNEIRPSFQFTLLNKLGNRQVSHSVQHCALCGKGIRP